MEEKTKNIQSRKETLHSLTSVVTGCTNNK